MHTCSPPSHFCSQRASLHQEVAFHSSRLIVCLLLRRLPRKNACARNYFNAPVPSQQRDSRFSTRDMHLLHFQKWMDAFIFILERFALCISVFFSHFLPREYLKFASKFVFHCAMSNESGDWLSALYSVRCK
jgi:hypothetical protein